MSPGPAHKIYYRTTVTVGGSDQTVILAIRGRNRRVLSYLLTE